jgi:Domain of unknown function (DUF4823)
MRLARRTVLIGGVLGALGLLSACKSTYSEKKLSETAPPLLSNTTRLYIARPFDAVDRKKVAFESGRVTVDSLYTAFSRQTRSVYSGKIPESVSEGLESARKIRADYLVYPTLEQWTDRATEYSGRRDRLKIKVEIIELVQSKLVFAQEIEATGRWMTDGGDTPKDLLDAPINNLVNSLFRRVERPSAL